MTDIVTFKKGETVQIEFHAKERDKSTLSLDSGSVVTMTIARTLSESAPLLSFTSPSSQIVITDIPNGVAEITLTAADLADIRERAKYYYSIWVDKGGVRLHQKVGEFTLGGAVQIV